MAKVGAQRAADLTGKSKSTIQRAMNSGKLSYEMDPNGRRVIDVSELERAFGLQQSESASQSASIEKELEKASSLLEVERMKMRIQMLEGQIETAETQIEDLKAQRDQWQKQASQVLITSQYSQKQAEELSAKLEEREKRARERRAQMEARNAEKNRPLQEKMKTMAAENQNMSGEADEDNPFSSLWKKVKGQK